MGRGGSTCTLGGGTLWEAQKNPPGALGQMLLSFDLFEFLL